MSTSGSGAIVVGIDGSESALQATRWAAADALSMHRPLRVVHGSIWPMINHPAPFGVVPAQYHAAMAEEARGWVRRARQVAEDAAPGITVEEAVLPSAPVPTLLKEAQSAHEVVVGSRGLGGFTGLLVGSTAVALTHHASCSVVVVRAEGDSAGPVVVGVDGTSASEEALVYAFDAASRSGAPLRALHTWSDGDIDEVLLPPGAVDWDAVEEDERRALAERLAGWQEKYPDVAVERVVARDRPAHRLLETGRRARLLVVGSRGRGGFTGMLLGSTSRKLVHHAPCPLAVVRS